MPTSGRILSANPLVCVYDEVFDADLAGALILSAADQRPITAIEDDKHQLTDARSNTVCVLDQWSNPAAQEVATRVSSLVRLPPEHCETAKVLRYQGGQEFKPHVDWFSPDLTTHAELLRHGGQRLFTTLCYLNTPNSGGETEFPHLKISVRPKLGRILLFSNTHPGTATGHPHAAHAGRPATEDDKWVMSLWWRAQLYHVPRDYPPEEGDTTTF